jgi:hypothetical protein
MITLELLKIYCAYEGNGDLFVIHGSEEEKEILDYDSWVLIDEIIRDFHEVGSSPVSKEHMIGNNGLFAFPILSPSFRDKLLENCDSLDVIHQLNRMAEKNVLVLKRIQ